MNKDKGQNYLWNMIGSIASALVSTALLLLASRNLSPAHADTLGITYTLSQQLVIIGLFQVRNFQSTDTQETYPFSSYLYARLSTIALMIATTLLFIVYRGFTAEKALILLLIVLTRALDALSDVFQGYYQQRHLSWIAGKILFIRSLTAVVVFGLSVFLSNSLLIASTSMFLVSLFLTIFLEGHYLDPQPLKYNWSENQPLVIGILKACFPLFLNGFFITYIFTEPKLVIDQLIALGNLQAGMQRDFNILFMPTFILNLLFAILRPLMTELADKWIKQETKAFFKQVSLIAALLVGIGLLGMILAYFIGPAVLSYVFGVQLRHYQLELVLLIAAGIFNVLATMIDNLMTIFRKQSYLLWIYILTFGLSKLLTYPLIIANGIYGAALSFLCMMFIYFLLSLLVFILILKQVRPSTNQK